MNLKDRFKNFIGFINGNLGRRNDGYLASYPLVDDEIPVGQQLSLAIPVRKKGKIIKRTGKIVWKSDGGVGIEFLGKENNGR